MNRIFRVGDRIFKVPQGTPEDMIPSIVESLSSLEPSQEPDQTAQKEAKQQQDQELELQIDRILEKKRKQEQYRPLKQELPAIDKRLGSLSAEFESEPHGGSLAVGKDPEGGVSFGKFQISEKQGTLDEFLSFIKDKSKDVYNTLSPLRNTAKIKSGEFSRAWKGLAESGKIQRLEYEFIKKTHYDKMLEGLKNQGIDLSNRSKIIQEVLWSTSVHHGAEGARGIISRINKTQDVNSLSDLALVNRIYPIRMRQFESSPPRIRASVKRRLVKERKKVVDKILQQEASQKTLATGGKNGENPRG